MSFFKKLKSGQFVNTVEVNPPASHDYSEAIKEVKSLPKFIDAVDITNCAFANVRISPIALGHIFQQECSVEVIINYTCTNRNIIATKSDLLGALALGLTNVLCMTGDDAHSGDHPEASNVNDLHTCSLIEVAKNLKVKDRQFSVGATTTPETGEENLQKCEAKIKAGADYFISQPVYSVAEIELAAALQEKIGKPIIVGVLPFKSPGMAKRLAAVPGINVPTEVIEGWEKCAKDNYSEYSVEHLIPIAAKAKQLLAGIHIMPVGETQKVKPLISALN